MTRFEKFQKMNLTELAQELDSLTEQDCAPWEAEFGKKFCENCESTECEYECASEWEKVYYGKRTIRLPYCELYDKCRFFPNKNSIPTAAEVIEMWLEEEVE
jgi:hypothetical protein